MVGISSKKKGQIMTAFLVKMILALMLLLASTAMIGSIFSILLDQSGENFADFTSDLEFVGMHDPGYKLSSLLILDEGSALVYFEGEDSVTLRSDYLVEVDSFGEQLGSNNFEFLRPGGCSEFSSEGCICLYQNIITEIVDTERKSSALALFVGEAEFHTYYSATSSSIRCSASDVGSMSITSCNLGTANEKTKSIEQSCENGFVIERNILGSDVATMLFNERRRSVFLESNDNGLYVEAQNAYNGPSPLDAKEIDAEESLPEEVQDLYAEASWGGP
ncbi:hypothetical protein HOA92_04345 [archaeon]|nr:hypothetical protein [archaeon]MBT6762245.1 hypothetical protein [archaeon]